MSGDNPDPHAQMRQRALSAGLRQHGLGVLHQDRTGRFDLAENLPAAWPRRDIVGRTIDEVLPTALAERFSDAARLVRNGGPEQFVDFELAEGFSRRALEAQVMADGDGVITIVTDVTDERAREAAVAALLREVSHRSKNLLAIVQSVAMQTAHHSGGVQDFLDKFRGRLHALSSTQDLVTESNWRGTYLHALVTSQLSRVGHPALAKLQVSGPNPLLSPNASLHIGLAIHELAANTVLHGALGDDSPRHVDVVAEITTRPDQRAELVLRWEETSPAAARMIAEPRFGTLVLERIVPLSVGGEAEYGMDGTGVHYRLTVPADQFEV